MEFTAAIENAMNFPQTKRRVFCFVYIQAVLQIVGPQNGTCWLLSVATTPCDFCAPIMYHGQLPFHSGNVKQ
jgi:hypothetical protein